jgi:hypothetical protein
MPEAIQDLMKKTKQETAQEAMQEIIQEDSQEITASSAHVEGQRYGGQPDSKV